MKKSDQLTDIPNRVALMECIREIEYGSVFLLNVDNFNNVNNVYGFDIVYKKDLDVPIADGFYFTINYPGMTGNELVANLLFYGVSAIALDNTGSDEEGIRACVSFVTHNQFAALDERLSLVNQNYSK